MFRALGRCFIKRRLAKVLGHCRGDPSSLAILFRQHSGEVQHKRLGCDNEKALDKLRDPPGLVAVER